jgi:type IV fimbrial biogenesis protein FimT
MQHKRGFTLTELMICLAIVAVLAALGVPSFRRQIAAAAVTAAVNQTMGALQLARGTALATGSSATLCLTPDGAHCGFGAREWMLFTNTPGGSGSQREAGEPLLRRWRLPRGVVVSGTRGHALFLPQTSAAATLTFDFCHESYPALHSSVVVSQTGRARISRPTLTSTVGLSVCRQ